MIGTFGENSFQRMVPLQAWTGAAAFVFLLALGVNMLVLSKYFRSKEESKMKINIREIEAKDNAAVEGIIRSCLIEYGANHEGTAWADPDLGRFSEIYNSEGNKYWVAEREDGKIVAGVGIGRLKGAEGVCELQKMYCLPEGRGSGISHSLMDKALEYASCYYERCYLETLENMKAAQKFYEKYGFVRIYEPIVKTEHFECDVRYIKDLDSNKEKKQTAYRE